MTTRLSPITVDDRQKTPPSAVRAAELRDRGVPATVARLDSGDYQWVVLGNVPPTVVLVEEKLPQDLIASVADGRLGEFVQEVVAEGTVKALLVTGDTTSGVVGGGNAADWTAGQVDNLLVSVQMSGVYVVRAKDPYAAASRLVDLYHYTGKEDHTTLTAVVRPEISNAYMDPEKRAAVRMLMCLPQLGEKRARAILERYGSVDAGLRAVKEWSDIGGIGQGLSSRASAFLLREFE